MATKRNVFADDGPFRILIEGELAPGQLEELEALIGNGGTRRDLTGALQAWANQHGLAIAFDELLDDRD